MDKTIVVETEATRREKTVSRVMRATSSVRPRVDAFRDGTLVMVEMTVPTAPMKRLICVVAHDRHVLSRSFVVGAACALETYR